jgi:hypothetical protein
MLALHIRRGDYLKHCKNLASWSAGYMGLNKFPELPDRFSPPAMSSSQENALHEEYRAHFFPEIDDIVTRVREVRTSLLPIMKLARVYVLTNGRP